VNGLLGEFAKVREKSAEPSELARSQRYLIGSREIGLQTNGALAEDMTFNELYGLGYEAGWKYAENISAVTLDDVQRVARHTSTRHSRRDRRRAAGHGGRQVALAAGLLSAGAPPGRDGR
jgi:predicted Zn-dependent peptidase